MFQYVKAEVFQGLRRYGGIVCDRSVYFFIFFCEDICYSLKLFPAEWIVVLSSVHPACLAGILLLGSISDKHFSKVMNCLSWVDLIWHFFLCCRMHCTSVIANSSECFFFRHAVETSYNSSGMAMTLVV